MQQREVIVKFKQSKRLTKDQQRLFYGGYLFLQQLYYDLRIDRICSDISKEYKFTYNLNSILSRLLYGRILFPSSKLNTFQESQNFWNSRILFSSTSIVHWISFVRKTLLFSQNYIKTAKLSPTGMTGYFFMIVQTSFLRLNRKTELSNMVLQKSTVPTPLLKWDCSWMVMVFLLLFPFIPETKENSRP